MVLVAVFFFFFFFKNGKNETQYLFKDILNVAQICVYLESWISLGNNAPISMFWLHISLRLGVCETLTKQCKYLEKHYLWWWDEAKQTAKAWNKWTIF